MSRDLTYTLSAGAAGALAGVAVLKMKGSKDAPPKPQKPKLKVGYHTDTEGNFEYLLRCTPRALHTASTPASPRGLLRHLTGTLNCASA